MYTGSPIEFSFSDDPQWKDAIYSITLSINSYPDGYGDHIGYLQKTVGGISLRHPDRGYYVYTQGVSTWVWTIKATGYPDTIVTVIVNR